MSSFYGNIKIDPRINLTFDKVYHNRVEMENNCKNDGVFNGRYILINYGIPYPSNFARVFIDEQTYNQNPSSFYSFLPQSFDPLTGSIVKPPQKQSSSIPYEIGKAYYVLVDKLKQELTGSEIGYNYVNEKLYAYNLWMDESTYGDSFHHTVWQKIWTSAEDTDIITEKYVMIACLDAKPPKLSLIIDAPNDTKGPHFDPLLSHELDYKFHVPRNWKFAAETDFAYNSDGFKPNKANNIGGKNKIVLDKTKKSGEQYPLHRNEDVPDAAVVQNGIIQKAQQADTCKFNISLIEVGNAISDMWDIVYPKVGEGNTTRDTFFGSDRAEGHLSPINIDSIIANKSQKYTLAGSIRYAWHMTGEPTDYAISGVIAPNGQTITHDPVHDTLWGNFNSVKELLGKADHHASDGTILGYWHDFNDGVNSLTVNWNNSIQTTGFDNIRIINKPITITIDATDEKGIEWFWDNPI